MMIDKRIRKLVDALNGIPGVETRGSCGGHENPDPRKGQAPLPNWFVHFHASTIEALNLVAIIALEYQEDGVVVFASGVDDEAKDGPRIVFEIRGACDPDIVASALAKS